ncbi:unnamed protein product, partial [Ranitomeya imitator]
PLHEWRLESPAQDEAASQHAPRQVTLPLLEYREESSARRPTMEPCPRRHMPASDVLTSGIPPMSPDSSGELSPFDLSGDIGDICPGSPTDDGLDGNQQDSSAGQKWDNHTEIAEQAKHEAEIENRIAELRKEGFWTPRRLSKFPEPARPKVHWDYLCEEMQWLSADFGQERRWKRGVARKVGRQDL